MAKIYLLNDEKQKTKYIINMDHVKTITFHECRIEMHFDGTFKFHTEADTPEKAMEIYHEILQLMSQ